jgi:Histidine kinase-, DNA gyrase B-, and HSP90-like ATPase
MASRPSKAAIHDDATLAKEIRASDSGNFVSATLKTDERVIARVTDGIYRQPGSALRELISNAYDADATHVVIKTDAPRFEKISIEDNGHGMTPEMLAHLLFHIGGSPKRSFVGTNLGITSKKDPTKSPGGRKLIGKIGIGLFSVSQLTHTFQIITKVRKDPHRTIATVVLKQYSDDFPSEQPADKGQFETGKVNIWREKAADIETQGTTIVLTSIRPQARDTLRSKDIWSSIEQNENLSEGDEKLAIEPPKFHIGRVDASGALLMKTDGELSSLPWKKEDTPAEAFRNMVNSVWQEVEGANPNPQLDRIFDYYLRMVWQLSLSIPVQYIEGHPFDLHDGKWATSFELSNFQKGAAQPLLPSKATKSFREILNLKDPENSAAEKFEVFFDDLQLLRPIKYRDLPTTNHAIKHPLIFFGKCREEFLKVPRELSGGPLSFEAYLFWNPKIAPTEHQGALVRIHGSSGTLFDPTFMRYQVSELTRLRQITCEIFVSEGLESALNIDRESFNAAHPHSVFITKWLFSALRQLATAQKRVSGELRQSNRDASKGAAVSEIQRVAADVWVQETGDEASAPPIIEFSEGGKKSKSGGEVYVFDRALVETSTRAATARSRAKTDVLEEKLKAIAQVLASFGLLDSVPRKKQEKLLRAIYEILEAPEA